MAGLSEATSGLLRNAWADLGGEADLLELVSLSGDEAGLLPSTLAALPAMLAAVAAATLAASVLDGARRDGAPAPVLVDAEHVALAARSERFARDGESEGADLFAPLSQFWRTADGWLRLHANYAWHRERALRVLGCRDAPESVEEAVLSWRGEELERALAASAALGFVVRSSREWRAHPQGSAVAELPLLEYCRPGRHPDAGRVGCGGAETGQSAPTRDPPGAGIGHAARKAQRAARFRGAVGAGTPRGAVGRGRRGGTGLQAGGAIPLRPGSRRPAQRHPHLSVVTLSAWGSAGPWAAMRGFDSLVQCSTGIASAEGDRGNPGTLPAQVLDHATGYLAAASALVALAGVERGEPPRSIRLSLAQTAQWLTGAGSSEREPPRLPRPERFLVSLPGAARRVDVMGPPGTAGDLKPRWTSTTELGADPAAFTMP